MDGIRGDDPETLGVFGSWYAAHESGDVAGLAAALGEDVVIHSLFKATLVQGRDAAVMHFLGVNATFSRMQMTLCHRPAAAEGRVLAEVEFAGAFTGELTWSGVTTRGAGQGFRVPGVVVVGVADGAVSSVRTLFDRDDWLRQIGVRSSDPDRARR
ncbi:nuclear transport factor 2 family protein [Nocardia sp. NPDC005745]|uniref:nuclear transport factor 2 family protein n=1 Tax=Nocardia sp. NPDC005745 TaxID=3157061 RepID=UPI0033D07B6D